MAYCSRCGVEVERDRKQCPLCDTVIHRYDDTDEGELSPLWPVQKAFPKMSKPRVRFFTLSPVLLALLIGFLVVLTMDLRMNSEITWSKYPLATIGMSFSIALGFLLFGGKRIYNLGWGTGSVLIMLYLLDSFDGSVLWFDTIGMPSTLLVSLYVGVSLISMELLAKKKGMQLTLQTLWITLLCLGIDYVVSSATGSDAFTWSLIVMVPLISIFTISLVSILVVDRFFDLDRYFHR